MRIYTGDRDLFITCTDYVSGDPQTQIFLQIQQSEIH